MPKRILAAAAAAVALTVTAALTGCGGGPGADAPATTIRLGVGDPAATSVGVSAKHFADKVAELSDGKIKVETFPDGTLFGGDQNAAVNLLGNGTLDSTIISTSVYASFEPKMNAISLPYLFKDMDEFSKYLEGEPGQELLGSLDKLGIKGVSMLTRTPRQTTNSVRPIAQPEDFKDLKIRVPQNDLWVKFFGSLGANPTPMDFKEVYTALQLGTIDGQENPLEVPVNNKFFEVQDYLSLTGHISDGYVLGFSKKKWDSFDDDTRKVLQDAAAETAGFKTRTDNDEAEKTLEKLKAEGVKVNELTPEAQAAFQQEAQKVYPELEGKVGKEFVATSLKFLGR
ncbi:C4-dicarboxylate ABC transporter substrate-binding protein [Arthrobacter sp. Leaf337]|uniref:DctP family TRAP transporter solute-binding subunit n=1 Tax=Arthrobacter sp. Leaf337 TaxID=1736342 RepID=UPI0006FFB780|nr:DctP family TRAP transporter solute-binding subunit [Arthrobacter sp. Leaf337]KQR73211.1 C4-dicarboxylate ABC transporter substrate-binding protein [Arthrobacter sp. Leaf337]